MQQSTIPVKIPTVFFVHVSNLVIYLKKNQGNQNNFEKVERIILSDFKTKINNLRCADDTNLMAESEEELKPLNEGEREE